MKTEQLTNVYHDQCQPGFDKKANTDVANEKIAIIPTVSPIQKWRIAIKSLSAGSAPPRYSTPQYKSDVSTVHTGTTIKSTTTFESRARLGLNFSLCRKMAARPT